MSVTMVTGERRTDVERSGPPYPTMEIDEKECFNCKRLLEISRFKPDTRRLDGWSLWCDDCRAAQRERINQTRSRGSINGGRLYRYDKKRVVDVTDGTDANDLARRLEMLTENERQAVSMFMIDLLLRRPA